MMENIKIKNDFFFFRKKSFLVKKKKKINLCGIKMGRTNNLHTICTIKTCSTKLNK